MKKLKNSGFFLRFYHNNRGFTLIELLVVISIFTILSGLTLLYISGLMPSMRLKSALTSLRGQLNNVKALAMKTNKDIILLIDPETESMEVWIDNNNTGIAGDVGTEAVGVGIMGEDIFLTDELVTTITLPPSIEFGFGAYPGAPASAPGGTAATGEVVWDGALSFVNSDAKYQLNMTAKGRFVDLNGSLASCKILLSNPLGKFAAIEVLPGGVAIPYIYNTKGDSTWDSA